YEDYITLPLVLSIVNDLAYNMYIYIFRFLIRARLNFGYYFINIMIPEIIFTTVTTLVVYRFFLFINRKLKEWEQRRDTTIV
ncbi:MAG: rod shape-determining protein MreD, partial [Clostridium sp.]